MLEIAGLWDFGLSPCKYSKAMDEEIVEATSTTSVGSDMGNMRIGIAPKPGYK